MPGTLIDTSVLLIGAAPAAPPSTAISVITLGELRAGVLLASDAATGERRREALRRVRALFVPIPVDDQVAECYGDVLALARSQARITKATDLLIIATALAHGRALVTGDERQRRLALAAGATVL